MTNKSFRIVNDEPEHATIWPIGTGEYFHVHWEEADEDTIYTKHQVESALERGNWTKLEESLPRTFKFTCHGSKIVYEYVQGKGYAFENKGMKSEFYPYKEEDARAAIEQGCWIVLPSGNPDVLPSEPEKKPIDTLQLKIEIDGLKEAYEILEDMVSISNTTLERIKDFTSGTGHDVYIAEGIYKVYRSGEDNPYVCHTDEQLGAVMDALTTLDDVEME